MAEAQKAVVRMATPEAKARRAAEQMVAAQKTVAARAERKAAPRAEARKHAPSER